MKLLMPLAAVAAIGMCSSTLISLVSCGTNEEEGNKPVSIEISGPDRMYLYGPEVQFTAQVLPEKAPQDITWSLVESDDNFIVDQTNISEGKLKLNGVAMDDHPNKFTIKLQAKSNADDKVIAVKEINGYYAPTQIDIVGDDKIYTSNSGTTNYAARNYTKPQYSIFDVDSVEWSIISGQEYASVNQSGQVSINKEKIVGSQEITLKAKSTCGVYSYPVEKTKQITIIESPTKIKIAGCPSRLNVGDEKQLSITTPESATASKDVKWEILDDASSYASITKDGLLKANAASPLKKIRVKASSTIPGLENEVYDIVEFYIDNVDLYETSGTTLLGFNTKLEQSNINKLLENTTVLPIDSNITEIAANAFDVTSGKLVIPENVKTLDLSKTNVTKIGASAFAGSKIENIIFGDKQSTFGTSAFASLSKLKKIDLSQLSSIASISGVKNGVFNKSHPVSGTISLWTDMSKSDVDKVIDYFGQSFLLNASSGWKIADVSGSLPTLSMLGGNIDIYDINSTQLRGFSQYFQLISSNEQQSLFTDTYDALVIPNTVHSIADYAFYRDGYGATGKEGCSIIPQWISKLGFESESNCTTIGEGAFKECSSLEEIAIPSSVETLGDYAFLECSSLKVINVSDFAAIPGWTDIYYPFSGVASEGTIYYSSSTTSSAWESLFESIDTDYSLNEWRYEEWTAPESTLFDIDPSGTLSGFNPELTPAEIEGLLDGISTLTIPNTVTKIAASAFLDDNDDSTIPVTITKLNFEESSQCTTIDDYAFDYAPFEEVVLPASLQNIGLADGYSFYGCKNLSVIDLSLITTVPTAYDDWAYGTFQDISDTPGKVYVNSITSPDDWDEMFGQIDASCTTLNEWDFETK